MDINTLHQHSTNSDTPDDHDQGEKIYYQSCSQNGVKKLDHDVHQMAKEGKHVVSESVSVVQRKKRTSVPVWRLVRACHNLSLSY